MSQPTPEHGGRRGTVPEERRRLILSMLQDRGSVSIAALEDEFGISPMTARRDLTLLEHGGRLRRTHGGAVLPELAAREDSFQNRLTRETDGKRRLARAVAEAIESHETVFLDSSTTAYEVASELLERGTAMTMLTNSLSVLNLVGSAPHTNIAVVGLGGQFRQLTQSFVGSDTIRAISGYFADRVVFSVKGISPEGHLTDPDQLESDVKRAMISHARSVVLATTAEKFGEHGLNVIAPADRVDVAYVVDAPPAGVRVLEAAGVEIIPA